MRFKVKEWRKIYDEVHRIGEQLKRGRRSWDRENKCWIASIEPMDEEEQRVCEKWIKQLLYKNKLYLDSCGMIPNKPLWKYNPDDTKTWPSHKDFIYEHLLKGDTSNVVPFVRKS